MSEIIDFSEVKASNALPSPKGVGLKIIQMCQEEQVSLKELSKLIQADPVLAGRIIKIANAVNRNKQRQIASITNDVLILVGVHAVRQVVLGISLVTLYKNGECENFDYSQFWSHSVAMACAAQMLTARLNIAPVAEMFTSGLLAGVGRLGLASARPKAYSALLSQYRDKPQAQLLAAESDLFGFSHISLAVAMMNDWNIPRLFTDGVFYHLNPDASPFPNGTRYQKIVQVMQMAARFADICIATDDRRSALIEELLELGAAAGIDAAAMTEIGARASAEWVEWGHVLNVPARALPLFRKDDELEEDAVALHTAQPD